MIKRISKKQVATPRLRYITLWQKLDFRRSKVKKFKNSISELDESSVRFLDVDPKYSNNEVLAVIVHCHCQLQI